MMRTVRIAACAAAFVVWAVTALAVEGAATCKNHYILSEPCDTAWEWTSVDGLIEARAHHTATLLPDGRVLVAGGTDRLANSAELYDPATRTWSLTGPMQVIRSTHTATLLLDGRVLVVGGYSAGYWDWGTAELYDPHTGTWTLAASLNVPRGGFTATLLNSGEVLVAGGFSDSYDTSASAELFDPATGTWRRTGDLREARYSHTATALPNGMILVAAGSIGDFSPIELCSAELYDPASGTWRSTGYLHNANVFHSATLLDDGRVLVAGGYLMASYSGEYMGHSTFTPATSGQSEIYDPATGEWSVQGELKAARYFHAATLLGNGQVLLSGGTVTTGQVPRLGYLLVTRSELFDRDRATFADASALNVARDRHTATRLLDGTVLVAGGGSNIENSYRQIPLRSAELYGPVGNAP